MYSGNVDPGDYSFELNRATEYSYTSSLPVGHVTARSGRTLSLLKGSRRAAHQALRLLRLRPAGDPLHIETLDMSSGGGGAPYGHHRGVSVVDFSERQTYGTPDRAP
jgi:hypothetical protein